MLNLLKKQFITKIHVFPISKRPFSCAKTSVPCWQCGHTQNDSLTLFCDKCQVIQKPRQSSDYFKVFNAPVKYTLDAKKLNQEFLKMQRQLHPDRFANKSEEEKQISAEYSALVNDAYQILQNPMNRAMHLLELNGQSIDEDDKVHEANFLMEIMELNEEVDEASDENTLRLLHEKNLKTLKTIEKKVAACFEKGDVAKAKEEIVKMKYFNSLRLKIHEAMRETGIVD